MSDNWARKLDNLGEMPRIFRDFMPKEYSGTFPYTVYAPADRWGFRKSHPKLMCILGGRLTFLELGRNGVTERTFSLADIACLEMGRILLHAWIRVGGIIEGRAVFVTMEFNSVVEDLFLPIMKTIRAKGAEIPPAGDEILRLEREKLGFLSGLSYKYANFAKISLMPGERVRVAFFEPDIRQKRLLGIRTVVPAHLVMLTDRELIIIRDDRHRDAHESYGGIWSYIPLGKIEQLNVIGDPGGDPSLLARLTGGECLKSRFSATNREGLQRLLEAFTAGTAGNTGPNGGEADPPHGPAD